MEGTILLLIALLYTTGIAGWGWWRGRRASDLDFYLAGRRAPWLAVAFGMIGTTLSGITFLSVPGWVLTRQWTYLQMVLGFVVGYLIIAWGLLPFYYRYGDAVTIYERLERVLGKGARVWSSLLFLVARWVGASLRLYLVAWTFFHILADQKIHVPFAGIVAGILTAISIYSVVGGIRSIIWTDVLQTAVMLLAVSGWIFWLGQHIASNSSVSLLEKFWTAPETRIWDWNPENFTFFGRYFLAGILIALAMTGMDQDMMQKNLSCRTLSDARKNVLLFAFLLPFVKLMFMILGALLVWYASQEAPELLSLPPDQLFSAVALHPDTPGTFQILFVLGLMAAMLSSADSALVGLTTSLREDLLSVWTSRVPSRFWLLPAVGGSIWLFAVVFYHFHTEAVIEHLFWFSTYLYGPLLGIFAWALWVRIPVSTIWTGIAVAGAPILTWGAEQWLRSQAFVPGYELLFVNAVVTCLLLIPGGVLSREKRPGGNIPASS